MSVRKEILMKYDFDKVISRWGTCSMKYDDDAFFHNLSENIRLDRDTIRLMIADTDFQCAPAITAAMHRVADFPNYGYTTIEAAPAFKESIISWYKRRFAYEIRKEWIITAGSALESVGQAVQAFSDPGEGVIICGPVYANFSNTIHRLNREVVNCQLLDYGEGDYRIDWEAFERVCREEHNKVYILCSPENPTGRVWSSEELKRMAEICRQNNVMLVSDEIHCDIVRRGIQHHPITAAAEDLSNIIMISGVNKSFNLMGLQGAYAIIPDDAVRETYLKDHVPVQLTPFTIAAVIAAYNESEDWLDALNAYIDETLARTAEYFRKKLPKVKIYIPEGTYVQWVDFSGYGYSQDLLQYLVNQEANVCVQGGLSHDPVNGEYYLRFAASCPRSVIFTAVDRISEAFRKYENNECEIKKNLQ